MSLHRTARVLVVITMLSGCRPFEAATSSPDAGESGGTVLGAGSDAPEHGGGPLPASCKALLQRDPGLRGKDGGVYTIDPDGPDGSEPIQVFCDLSLADGGWTLVGRSAETAAPTTLFGWRTNTGNVTDNSKPYSLDVASAKLTFTEVLVADQELETVYAFTVPSDFLTKYATSAGPVNEIRKVRGKCGESAPSMLSNAGHTSATDGFFFRDNEDVNDPNIRTGLKPNGFYLYYGSDCDSTGQLGGKQGVIFVR
jgi:hypothetical protein